MPDYRQKEKKKKTQPEKELKQTPDHESRAHFFPSSRPILTSCTPHSKHLFSSTGSGVWQYRHTGHLDRTPNENGTDGIQEMAVTESKVKNCILNLWSLTYYMFIITNGITQECKLLSKEMKKQNKTKS